MTMRFTVTDEDYQKAITDKQAFENLLNRLFAQTIQSFWEKSHEIVIWMVAESIPFLTAMEEYLKTHEHLRTPQFVAAVYDYKNRTPNKTPMEVLDAVAGKFTENNSNGG